MSSNGASPSASTPPPAPHAIDVGFSGFSSIGQRHGESSSQAESRSSSKRSSHSQKREGNIPAISEPAPQDELRISTGSRGSRTRNSGGFLLDSAFANGSPRSPTREGKRKAPEGQLRVDKRRLDPTRLSGDSSLRSSPLSREVSMDVDGPADGREQVAAARPSSMDAAQLVQMALNLSESRKRNVSNTLRVPSGADRRVTSMPVSNVGTVRASPGARQRSTQLSEDSARASPASDNNEYEEAEEISTPPFADVADNIFYTFTPATLARAEKARKYLELASEHRRLLQSLPPLKQDAASSSGRQYNPIQSLRNRRVRIRDRRPFTAPPETWTEPEKVKQWIDDVASATKYTDFDNTEDSVVLPTFDGENSAARPESRQIPTGPRHKRSETAGSVITRPENSWTIEPTELLADAYWTEKGDNKALIESRRGDLIFPSRLRQDTGTPKISIDLHRDRNDDSDHWSNRDESESVVRPSRRRKLMIPLTAGLDRGKHGRLIRRGSVSSTDSSKERHASGVVLSNGSPENTGPLERHMQELIEKEERGELSSPEMASPDRWNSRFKQLPLQRGSIDRVRRDSSASRRDGRASLDVPRDLHRRARSADGRVGTIDNMVSDPEDDTGSDPGSPRIIRNIPSIGMDLSPTLDPRRSLDDSRSKVPALPSFHSRSKERNKISQADFADGSTVNLSPIPSAGSYRPSDASTPDQLKRYGTNDSYMPMMAMKRSDTSSTYVSSKEPGSTVGRFLKNRRDRLFKGKDRADGGDGSGGVTDVSEGEETASLNGPLKKRATDYESDESPRASYDQARSKQKFHLSNLPSFTSSARDKRIQIVTPGSNKNDPFSQQAKRSKRFDRLAPPLINIPQAGPSYSEVTNESDGLARSQKSYGQLQTLFGEVWRNEMGPGIFTPGISQAKRHWSIYDKLQPDQDDKVTTRDVARARALLLSSGIKAREIQRRADAPSEPPPTLVTKAAATARQPLEVVPLKEEHNLAARLLAGHLSSSMPAFETTLSHFQNETVRQLSGQIEALRQRAADQLSTLVHDTSDDADAFIMELNTKTPQQTKRVDDAVDEMLRRRRRQFRLLRVTGFKMLEWLVLGLLWWIWFLVVVFNTARKLIVGIWTLLRWLLVF